MNLSPIYKKEREENTNYSLFFNLIILLYLLVLSEKTGNLIYIEPLLYVSYLLWKSLSENLMSVKYKFFMSGIEKFLGRKAFNERRTHEASQITFRKRLKLRYKTSNEDKIEDELLNNLGIPVHNLNVIQKCLKIT